MQDQENHPQKAKQKDIEEVFVCSQFINTVKIINSEQDFKLLKSLNDIDPNSQMAKEITPYHFRQLAIQFFYLLYSSSHKRIVPAPSQSEKFLCFSFDHNTLILCINQFITFETSTIKNYETETPYFYYYHTFIKAIHPFWKDSQSRMQQQIKRESLTADFFLNHLIHLVENNQLHTEKQAFSSFQRLQIFVQTSVLLRIRNSSLICVMKRCSDLMNLYKKHCLIQNQLSQQYNDRRKRKNNIQQILQTQKNIEKNIEQFFVSLKTNPRFFKIEDKRKKEGQVGNMNNKMLIGLKVFQTLDMRENNTNKGQVNINSNGGNKMDVQPKIDEDYYNIYEIQYCSAKNVIVVRMITDLILDWATSDSILFKWNTLTFQTSNVGLQTVEKLDEQKKPKKFVVIRGTSYFNKKQPVLQKILTLIDITMATYKSIELQMKSQTFFAKNLAKIDESYKKINHYLRTIHKCCMRSYGAMLYYQGG